MQSQKSLKSILILKIIWAALFFSLFVYGGTIFYKISTSGSSPGEVKPIIAQALSSMAIFCLLLAVFLPRYFIKQEKIKLNLTSSTPINLEGILEGFAPYLVLRFVLLESVTIFGFVLAFLSDNISYYLPFLAISVLGYIMNFPTEEKIKNMIKSI